MYEKIHNHMNVQEEITVQISSRRLAFAQMDALTDDLLRACPGCNLTSVGPTDVGAFSELTSRVVLTTSSRAQYIKDAFIPAANNPYQ
jgi:hypothetical protein